MKHSSLGKILFIFLFINIGAVRSFAQAETQNPNAAAGTFWRVRGNTGTNTTNNFIGTADKVDLVIRTDNIERMRISQDGFAAINALPSSNDYLFVYSSQKGPNLSNIYALNEASIPGSDWSVGGVAAVMKAYSFWGDAFSVGIAGYSYQDYAGSAAVVGARFDGSGSGFLAYFDGTRRWGIYTPAGVPGYVGGDFQLDGSLEPNGDPGLIGQVLTSNGAGTPPVWATVTGGSSGWLLAGNAGTTAGTDFVGTTDGVDLVFKTQGNEKMRIVNSTGNVGIGTASATQKLRVAGNVLIPNANSYMSLDNTGTVSVPLVKLSGYDMYMGEIGNGNYQRLHLIAGTAPGSYVSIDNMGGVSMLYARNLDGNVGIGTVSPSQKLHVAGNVILPNSNAYMSLDNTGTVSVPLVKLTGYDMYMGEIGNGNYQRMHLVAGTAPGSYVSIDNMGGVSMLYVRNLDGNVGIGTTSPSQKLHVTGNVLIPNSNAYMSFDNTGTVSVPLVKLTGYDMYMGEIGNGNYQRMHLVAGTAPGSYVSIDNMGGVSMLYVRNLDGNVGIGTTSPSQKLHVTGNVLIPNSNAYMSFDNTGTVSVPLVKLTGYDMYMGETGNGNYQRTHLVAGTAPGSYVAIENMGGIPMLYARNSDGNIGLGTSAPAYQLELSTNSAGKPTSGLWTVSSDIRLKKDIRPYEGGLKELLMINPVWYRYNGVAGLPTLEEGVGTIAQELEKVAPYMIKPYIHQDSLGNATEYKSVDYNAMLFMFVNAFKEQQKVIEKVSEQNTLQQQQIDELIKQNNLLLRRKFTEK